MPPIFTDTLDLDTRFSMPDLHEGHPLSSVLMAALHSRAMRKMKAPSEGPYWPSSFFGLDRTSVYRDASNAERYAMLAGCSRSVLSEIYSIEKSGMYFASKMCLLSESLQERMLFSLFAADEAIHFHWISPYASKSAAANIESNSFLLLLDEVLQKDDRMTLSYIIQVVLEGWGIHYYRELAKSCLDESLASVFEQMLRDEGRHHAAGLAHFKQRPNDWKGTPRILEVLTEMLKMAQAGPQMVVSQIERAKGGLTPSQRTRIFSELECEAESKSRIDVIKSLVDAAAGGGAIISELERRGALRTFSATECAALM
jgi:hypothetical protein